MNNTTPPPPPPPPGLRLPPPPPYEPKGLVDPEDPNHFPGWVTWGPREAWLGLLVGLIAGFLFAPALVLPFDTDLSSDMALIAAQALLGLTLIVVSVGFVSGWTFKPLSEVLRRLGLRRFDISGIGWLFVAMFSYYLLAGLYGTIAPDFLQPEQDDIGGELGVGDESLVVAVLAVLLIVGVASIAEELFFRGYLFGGFRSRFGLWPAAILAGVIFGAIHAPTGPTAIVPLAGLGVAFCWLYEKTQSLWPCVIAHAINNGLALALAGSLEDSVVLPFGL